MPWPDQLSPVPQQTLEERWQRKPDNMVNARDLATKSSNSRGMVQASLYSGEVLRRLKRLPEAQQNLNAALDGARNTGLPDEQWRALYSLGLIAEDEQHPDLALTNYQAAIVIIETVRAGLQLPSLDQPMCERMMMRLMVVSC